MSHVLNSASGNGALAGTKSVGYSNPELIGKVSIAEAYKILKAEALIQAGYYDPTVKDSIVKILQNTATMNIIINVNESIKAT